MGSNPTNKRFDLFVFFGPDKNLFGQEEKLLHEHVRHLTKSFEFATVVVIIESNSDHRWPARLCQLMSQEFGQRVKFACSWKKDEKQSIGVHTGNREKVAAVYCSDELFRHGMVMYWDKFFSCGFSEPGTTAKEFHAAQLKQLRLEPSGSGKYDDPELVVTGKSGNDQDDLAIATILGLMWAALFKFDPKTMRDFGIPVSNNRMRAPSQFINDRIATQWKTFKVGAVPKEMSGPSSGSGSGSSSSSRSNSSSHV